MSRTSNPNSIAATAAKLEMSAAGLRQLMKRNPKVAELFEEKDGVISLKDGGLPELKKIRKEALKSVPPGLQKAWAARRASAGAARAAKAKPAKAAAPAKAPKAKEVAKRVAKKQRSRTDIQKDSLGKLRGKEAAIEATMTWNEGESHVGPANGNGHSTIEKAVLAAVKPVVTTLLNDVKAQMIVSFDTAVERAIGAAR